MEKFETELNTLHPILSECRVLKSDHELALIQFANDISSEAHVEVTIWWWLCRINEYQCILFR